MHSGVLFIAALTLVCWAIQLLPVISVPITGANNDYRFELSHFRNISYGVFGFCQTQYNGCSAPAIGYEGEVIFPYVREELQVGNPILMFLPSKAMRAFSKFLFVHVIAFVFASFLLLATWICLVHEYFGFPDLILRNRIASRLKRKDLKKLLLSGPTLDVNDDGAQLRYLQKRRRLFRIYFDIMIVFAIFSFLLALLGFLADILMFVSNLGWVGWIQIAPVLIMALISSLLCFMKRSITSRRHLEEEVYALGTVSSRQSDLASDLGVYIYSSGFFTSSEDHEMERINIARERGQTD